jgi:hypothetical protein
MDSPQCFFRPFEDAVLITLPQSRSSASQDVDGEAVAVQIGLEQQLSPRMQIDSPRGIPESSDRHTMIHRIVKPSDIAFSNPYTTITGIMLKIPDRRECVVVGWDLAIPG